jgi:hypothetical protein
MAGEKGLFPLITFLALKKGLDMNSGYSDTRWLLKGLKSAMLEMVRPKILNAGIGKRSPVLYPYPTSSNLTEKSLIYDYPPRLVRDMNILNTFSWY